MSLNSNAANVYLNSNLDTDKIIGSFSGSLSAPVAIIAGSKPSYTTVAFTTNFNDTCLTASIHSLDSGTSWNDDNFSIPTNPSSATPTFQNVDVSSFSKTNTAGIAVSNWTNSIQTVQFKLYCYAKSNQGAITPNFNIPATSGIAYASKYNYQKILTEQIVPITVPASSNYTYTYTHNLGVVPHTRSAVEYVTTNGSGEDGIIFPATQNQFIDGTVEHNLVPAQVIINSTTYTVVLSNAASPFDTLINLHFRIYYDD